MIVEHDLLIWIKNKQNVDRFLIFARSLFFKAIKQNLKLKSFLGRSRNAIQTQIWIALIAYLLV
ncbi:hypothetical protein, partial [Acinetobacter junii]|uniref:hypothetical protein n=1 Tax=Acinetobacter junii TaxID=40215 RepID=UPI003A4DBBAA